MAGHYYRKYLPELLKQEAEYKSKMINEIEDSKLEIAKAQEEAKEFKTSNELINELNKLKNLDSYSIGKYGKYGIIFLIILVLFFILKRGLKNEYS